MLLDMFMAVFLFCPCRTVERNVKERPKGFVKGLIRMPYEGRIFHTKKGNDK